MKSLLQIALFFLISIQLTAQQKTIKGTVTDALNGLPLAGVTIMIKGTTIGVQTNFDGEYSIMAQINDVLNFTYVGYKSQESTVKKESVINVILEEDNSSLEEVVVTAMGIRRNSKPLSFSVKEISSDVHHRIERSPSEPQSGQMTAGEINDLEKWDAWLKALKSNEYQQIREDWGYRLKNRVDVTVSDSKTHPLNNVAVSLYDEKNTLIMVGRTDVYGKVTLFKDFEKNNESKFYTVQVLQNQKTIGKKITNTHDEVAFVLSDQDASTNNIDVMFTIDATGSMGDEINYLKSELKNIISRLDKSIAEKRVALTFYRDHGDEYLVKDFDFSTNIDTVKAFLSQQSADGGGDYEEAVEEALKVSMAQSWQMNSKSKLLFLLLDAPPHFTENNVTIIKKQIKIAQEKGIRIIPIVASGADKNTEFLMRYFSIATNGTYVFLTDDSGIGNSHIKPTTDDFKVEKLNDLIVRLIENYAGVAR